MFFFKHLKKTKKIGIFGGAFDPIHKGHLQGALAAKQAVGLDEVWFLPATKKYFTDLELTDFTHRFNFVKIAIAKYKYFFVKDDEFKNKIKNTYELVLYFQKKYKNFEFLLIIGDDQLQNFSKWNNASELAKLVNILVLRRTIDQDNNEPKFKKIIQKYNMNLLANKVTAISATELRKGNFLEFIETPVIKYINDKSLYARERAKSFTDDKRFKHIDNVVKLSCAFAKKHRLNLDKAYAAAIYHDIAKQWSHDELTEYIKKHLPIHINNPIQILHQFVGAHYVKTKYGVTDMEVVSAIQKHTTAEIKMSPYDKLLYCADKLSDDRNFKEKEYLKEEVFKNLNKGFEKVLMHSALYLESMGVPLDKKNYYVLRKFCIRQKEYQNLVEKYGFKK